MLRFMSAINLAPTTSLESLAVDNRANNIVVSRSIGYTWGSFAKLRCSGDYSVVWRGVVGRIPQKDEAKCYICEENAPF